eukprot:TRINITY_DN44882_c0_g1_i1.p1 TRINITY_DN44882_c0_g1~~TRINITY_DN44882_c0_g1_i1.p1  ORF type:complete len:199 (+),score=18.14 TRINITY_DN44882_c0_g1_i1:42-638(+)
MSGSGQGEVLYQEYLADARPDARSDRERHLDAMRARPITKQFGTDRSMAERIRNQPRPAPEPLAPPRAPAPERIATAPAAQTVAPPVGDPYSDAYIGGPHRRPMLRSQMLQELVGQYDTSGGGPVADRRAPAEELVPDEFVMLRDHLIGMEHRSRSLGPAPPPPPPAFLYHPAAGGVVGHSRRSYGYRGRPFVPGVYY